MRLIIGFITAILFVAATTAAAIYPEDLNGPWDLELRKRYFPEYPMPDIGREYLTPSDFPADSKLTIIEKRGVNLRYKIERRNKLWEIYDKYPHDPPPEDVRIEISQELEKFKQKDIADSEKRSWEKRRRRNRTPEQKRLEAELRNKEAQLKKWNRKECAAKFKANKCAEEASKVSKEIQRLREGLERVKGEHEGNGNGNGKPEGDKVDEFADVNLQSSREGHFPVNHKPQRTFFRSDNKPLAQRVHDVVQSVGQTSDYAKAAVGGIGAGVLGLLGRPREAAFLWP